MADSLFYKGFIQPTFYAAYRPRECVKLLLKNIVLNYDDLTVTIYFYSSFTHLGIISKNKHSQKIHLFNNFLIWRFLLLLKYHTVLHQLKITRVCYIDLSTSDF